MDWPETEERLAVIIIGKDGRPARFSPSIHPSIVRRDGWMMRKQFFLVYNSIRFVVFSSPLADLPKLQASNE